MKKLLKIMSAIALTSITAINVNGCDVFHNSPVDYNQLLQDAADLIANDKDGNFINFLKDKSRTHVSDFIAVIKENISNLFSNAEEDFSNLTYDITNGNDNANANTTIKIYLAVNNHTETKNCSFVANFNYLQDYINQKLKPLVDGKQYFSISKDDKAGFYHDLVSAGATFKHEDKTQKEQYFRKSSSSEAFWKKFQEWKPTKEIKNPLLGNVLYPLLSFIGNTPVTGLTFDNFKPYLLNRNSHDDVIAVTGNKEFDGQNYDYIKIGLAGQNSDTADLGNKYEGITYIFVDK